MLRQIAELAEEGVFDPESVRILVAAFDSAWASVKSSGAPFAAAEYAETARYILARHIIDAAKKGERNVRILADGALLQLAQSELRKSR